MKVFLKARVASSKEDVLINGIEECANEESSKVDVLFHIKTLNITSMRCPIK
jgi:hypothetical protein